MSWCDVDSAVPPLSTLLDLDNSKDGMSKFFKEVRSFNTLSRARAPSRVV